MYTYLSRLRQVIRELPDVELAQRRGIGYVVTVDPMTVDLHRFHHLLDEARIYQDVDRAVALFDEALALWRGEPCLGLDTPWMNAAREGLRHDRLAAQLDRTDLLLHSGRHQRVLAEVTRRARAYPVDERIHGQLMLTLYLCGRQVEALDQFQQLRHRLAGDLGIGPGAAPQRLHQQILAADPALGSPGTAAQPPIPRQLPCAPPGFTGRRAAMATLTDSLPAQGQQSVSVVVVSGIGGIGKTGLVLHWAHQHQDRFPDGQLFVDLRGFAVSGEPLLPATAVRGFLDALGVAAQRLPPDVPGLTALFRSHVAGKRMLIVLDNAYDPAQVIPLLPGTATCVVLITSRSRMTGLVSTHDATLVALRPLSRDQSHDLLRARLGNRRVVAEPDAVADLARACAGLPLAITVVIGRVRTHPNFRLTSLAADLRDTATRLRMLDGIDSAASVPAALSWSYARLTSQQRHVFGLLAIAPGPDIGLPAAAALTDIPLDQLDTMVAVLEQVSLLDQHVPRRYHMHDLVRLVAIHYTHRDVAPANQFAALRRLTDFYLDITTAGAVILDPHRAPPGPHRADASTVFPDDEAALRWFAVEHDCLLATVRAAADKRWCDQVWRLAMALTIFHESRGHLQDDLRLWQTVLAGADHLDVATSASIHRQLGYAYSRLGQHTMAFDQLHTAGELADQTGEAAHRASVRMALASVSGRAGDNVRALEHATAALDLYRSTGAHTGEARALSSVGWFAALLGDHAQARLLCEQALVLQRRHGTRVGEAVTLDSLGFIADRTGDRNGAVRYYTQALSLYQETGHQFFEVETLNKLGHVYRALGRHDQARAPWQEALMLYRRQHRDEDATRIERQLAGLDGPDQPV